MSHDAQIHVVGYGGSVVLYVYADLCGAYFADVGGRPRPLASGGAGPGDISDDNTPVFCAAYVDPAVSFLDAKAQELYGDIPWLYDRQRRFVFCNKQ